jgi:hypothetical protein
MCRHLIKLDDYIKNNCVKELFRGKAWSKNCNEWVYYDCIINIDKIKQKMGFDDCVKIHEYNDFRIANELGFYCNICKDGIMGFSPNNELTMDKTILE